MLTLKIGFSSPKKWMPYAEVIKCFENTPYSHVFIEWRHSRKTKPLIFQASGSHVNIMTKDTFDDLNNTVKYYEFKITKKQYDVFLDFCFDNLGKHYGILQVIGIGLSKMMGRARNQFSDGKSTMICSEIVMYFLAMVLDLNMDIDADIVTPRDIDEFLTKVEEAKWMIS